jgi:hypothetical protein
LYHVKRRNFLEGAISWQVGIRLNEAGVIRLNEAGVISLTLLPVIKLVREYKSRGRPPMGGVKLLQKSFFSQP